jgi:(p)ppGpp synthase/HD superfamily hydrolase
MFSIPPVAAVMIPAAAFSVDQSQAEVAEASFQKAWSPAKEQIVQLANHPAVEQEFDTFSRSLESAFNQGAISYEGMEKIREALIMGAYEHRNQKRESKSNPNPPPYIYHPIQVANHLLAKGGITDPDILAAALLHDTVEDCKTSPDEIERRFGARVRQMVDELTDKPGLSSAEQMQYQLEHAPNYLPDAALIKISDRTCVLNELFKAIFLNGDTWISKERVVRYFEHTEKFFSIMKEHGVLNNEGLFNSLNEILETRKAAV